MKNSAFLENFEKPSKKRIFELDFLRGFSILLMIFDHAMFLAAYTFGMAWFGSRPIAHSSFFADLTIFARWYWTSAPRNIIHPIILFIFFSISGISSYFSRSNLKRGAELGIVAIAYSLISYYLQNDLGVSGIFVQFGVLNMLATCVFIVILITGFFKLILKDNMKAKYWSSFVFFLFTLTIILMYFLYEPPSSTPKRLFFLFPPGIFFTQAEVSPGDFFPMIPWSSFFFFGAAIGPVLYRKRQSLFKCLDRAWHRPVSFIGRHSLLIYLAHSVVLTLIFALLSFFLVKKGDWVIF